MSKIPFIIFISLLPFLLSSCGDQEQASSPIHYETFVTQAGTITLRDSIIASVEGGTTSDLAFKNGGRIVEIHVHPGDSVKKGQILARLDNNESSIMVDGLGQVASGLSQVEVSTESMRVQTESMKLSIEKLYDERISQAENNIRGLKNELLKNEKNLIDNVDTLNQNFFLQLNNIINLANTSLHEGDKILGITTNFEYDNDGWENYLGVRSGSSKADADNAWGKLYSSLGELRRIRESKVILTPENSDTYIRLIDDAYVNLGLYHEKMVFMLENSVVGAGLALELRDRWNNTFNTFKKSTSEIEGIFLTWKGSITPLLVTLSGSKSSGELSIDTLRINLENSIKNKDILIAEKKSKLREISINIIEIEAKKGEIGTKLAETKMNEFLARDARESDIIRAPYDGVILEKYMNVGTIIGPGIPLLRITSEDRSILRAYIDNTLYEYKKGDILEMENPVRNKTFTGMVSLLQKERDPIHNKNYIEVTLSGSDTVIGERMIMRFSRKKVPRENGTIIPVGALISRYGPPGVYLIEDNTIRFQLVEVLGSDLVFAEVIGIREGSTLVTKGKENMYDGQVIGKKITLSGE